MQRQFIIGSRGSKLALWQAEWVRARLLSLEPPAEVRIEVIKTSGDVLRDVPLSVIGGKGVFTKELEETLLDGRIDIAVHSLKDLPTVLPERLTIAAVTVREDARDALVLRAGERESYASLRDLPRGACIGTSSLRRMAQLRWMRPDLRVKDVRGNVDTRLRKLDAGEYDALILASAGLRRLGLAERISTAITVGEMLPAVGQGALGIETRADDAETNRLVNMLDDAPTRAACTAERALLRALGGGCQVPIAAHGTVNSNTLRLEALVAALSGARVIRGALEGDIAEAEGTGAKLAAVLDEQGAASLLEGLTT
ncbi:MAG TPA: hydroxymethylbilane synthase [Pyrinomonadaceae bacterium]|nr:hydroxymethylbilane synthase [Pyrinomonadaceae bacterium]